MPNTVPAAATGLPKLSRRKLVSALAASPMIAVPALASAAVMPVVASDALIKLTATGVELQAISERLTVLWRMYDRTALAARRLIGPPLKPDYRCRNAAELARKDFYYRRSKERFEARRDRIATEQGHNQVRAEISEAEAQRGLLESELLHIPATDIPSLIVKARIAQRHMHATQSVIADMLAILGGEQ